MAISNAQNQNGENDQLFSQPAFSVETVQNLLKLDNKGIAKLCAQVSLMPKKDGYGRAYFSKDDVEILRKVKGLYEQSYKMQNNAMSNPAQPIQNTPQQPVNVPQVRNNTANNSVSQILSSIQTMENIISDKLSKIIDEKLDGMDEVVVELVRCKTENETLRYKLNELNKENYNLKNEISKFKNVGLGLYVKKNGETLL